MLYVFYHNKKKLKEKRDPGGVGKQLMRKNIKEQLKDTKDRLF